MLGLSAAAHPAAACRVMDHLLKADSNISGLKGEAQLLEAMARQAAEEEAALASKLQQMQGEGGAGLDQTHVAAAMEDQGCGPKLQLEAGPRHGWAGGVTEGGGYRRWLGACTLLIGTWSACASRARRGGCLAA